MRFLLDQDVYASTARFLRDSGHDVLCAYEAGLAEATDSALLAAAERAGTILVTRDRDFGSLVFVRRAGSGVIYLRTSPRTLEAVHRELAQVLAAYSEEQLRRAFVVVEAGRHRIRRMVRR
jgi:predicted nuclease of predicted toxin-antitoxin system